MKTASYPKIILKIVDEAIFPAALLVIGKLAGIIIANRTFGLDWSFQSNPSDLFSLRIVYPEDSQVLLANSFSNLTMYMAILGGNLYVIFRAFWLHDSHQEPKTLIRLAQFNLLHWLTDSFTLYTKGFVWAIFLWIATLLISIGSLYSQTYDWVAAFTLVLTVLTTWGYFRDVQREVSVNVKGK